MRALLPILFALLSLPALAKNFNEWNGACSGTGKTCTTGASQSVKAGFSTGNLAPYNGDGTVTDPHTGLSWMRCAMGQTWTGSTCSGTANTFTLGEAWALGGTGFAGQSDWRLPTEEVQKIPNP